MSVESLIKDFKKVLKESDQKKTSSYDTAATVKRIDGNTAWVHIPSGVDETPVKLTVNAKVGDTVQVRVGGGKAWITGNATRPPTDDTVAIYANNTAVYARENAVVAKNTADEAQGTATSAKETAEAILIYDHDYELKTIDGHLMAIFTARLYRGGVDIHTLYDPSLFTWYMKTEDGQQYLGNGYTVTVDTTTCGYGAEIIGKFTTTDDAELLTDDGDNLTDNEGQPYTGRASGNSVRVSDLAVSTVLYDSEKIMVVGNEDEHLVTVRTLQDYLNANLDKQVLFNTTAGWSTQTTLVSDATTLYVYTDHQKDSGGNDIAGIKVGDGNAFVVDLPFIDAVYAEHVQDGTIHITDTERQFWNNKVRCYYAGTEQLVFTTE